MCEKVTHEGSEHKRQLSSEWQCAVMEREQLCANCCNLNPLYVIPKT